MTPTPRKPDRPVLWIIAGPNGSGKSSLYNQTDIEGWNGSVWINNPDLLTAAIVERECLSDRDANLAAVERIERWLYASIEAYQTIGVETVLSSGKYRKLVRAAHHRGFLIKMVYVCLASAEEQISRVARRVRSGGHDVPADKIISRRLRSFEQLSWFFGAVDECLIYGNSGGEPQLLGGKRGGELVQLLDFPPDLLQAFHAAGIVPVRLNNPATWHLL